MGMLGFLDFKTFLWFLSVGLRASGNTGSLNSRTGLYLFGRVKVTGDGPVSWTNCVESEQVDCVNSVEHSMEDTLDSVVEAGFDATATLVGFLQLSSRISKSESLLSESMTSCLLLRFLAGMMGDSSEQLLWD